MPASSQAWIRVMPAGTSCSLPSIMSLGMLADLPFRRVELGEAWRWRRRCVARVVEYSMQEGSELRTVLLEVAGGLIVGRQQIVAVRLELDANRRVPFLGRRDLHDFLA